MNDPLSSEVHGYHLFLEPSGEVRHQLEAVITTLAEEYGGPVFPPHVTLLSHIAGSEAEIAHTAAQVASILPVLHLTLGELETEDAYFRALYSAVLEQKMLTKAYTLAANVFSMEPRADYRAHLSLLYGNYPAEQKARSIATISLSKACSFQALTLSLYKTEGSVGNWRKLQDFPLVH